jgi:hypothetical protein
MIHMKKEFIFVLSLISISAAILIPASLGQDIYGINNTTMNNTAMNNTTVNLTQNAMLQNLALVAPVNLTSGENSNLSNETPKETSPAILLEGASELTTDIEIDKVANATANAPIDASINESKDAVINDANINMTANLTASRINGDAMIETEAGFQAKTLPTIEQDETFMLGKALVVEKPFEIVHLTKPMMDVSKQVFISNNV